MVAKIVGALVGALAVGVVLAAFFGWLVALCWNHFPFMEAAHHMSWWDGCVMSFLAGLLFRGAGSANSSS